MDSNNNIPSGWTIRSLADIGEIVSGGTPSTAVPEYWNGDINWISPVDLSGYMGKYISKGNKSITPLGLQKSSARLMPKGSVLFSSRAPIGYVAIASDELCTNQGFKSIIPNKMISNEYLYYFLKYAKKQAEDLASGTTFKEISLSNFAKIRIPVPPLDEQRRIVAKIEELFSSLDKGIESLKAAQQQLKIYRQSVLKWAFEGRLTNNDIKNNDLPDSWAKISLGDCTYNFDGKRVPLSKEVRSKRKGAFPYYGATGIVDYIDDFLFDGKYLLIGEDGANLLSKSKPLAFIVEGKFWVNNHAHIMQTKNGFELAFICHFFNSLNLDDHVTGTAQPKLTQASMNKIVVLIPHNQKEQKLIVAEIERRLSVCSKLEENIYQGLQQSEALRQSILKKAFKGKLVAHDQDNHLANSLLEQIRPDMIVP